MPISQQLTAESWSDEHPRTKQRIGDKVVYIYSSPSGFHPMSHELEMMKLASSVGIKCPAVYSYSCAGDLEVSVMEYVEGDALSRSPENAEARHLVRRALESMDAVERNDAVMGSHLLFVNGARFPSSEALYAHWIHHVATLKALFEAPGPDIHGDWLRSVLPTEPCVLMHGDVSDDNVIVTPDGICLIDWECSGFLPRSAARAMSGTLELSGVVSQTVDCLYRSVKHSALREIPEFSAQLSRLEGIRLKSEALGRSDDGNGGSAD
jgi:tRNA A-37 threonylcarbamoyl transferase component Bud32